MSTARRTGKPYIWVTWLAKLLGGNECVWSAWFKAHFKYDKYEEQAADLVRWNRDHTKLMAARRLELERDGWTVTVEDDNSFKLEGDSAVVAGKMDLVAVKGDRVLVVDGKTGRERDSDMWQILLYLFALPKSRPDLPKNLEGEVHYKSGDISLTPAELTRSVSINSSRSSRRSAVMFRPRSVRVAKSVSGATSASRTVRSA